jgi:phosphoserine phosphatase
MAITFHSTDEFYAAREQRRRSMELDFGCWWTERETDPLTWRVSWIEDTGETYAVSSRGEVRLFPGTRSTREAIELALEGWSQHCGPGGLRWTEERLAS